MTTPFILAPPEGLLTQAPELGHMASDLSMHYTYRYVVSETQLKTIGQALWQALKIDEADFQYRVSQTGVTYLPLILQSANPAIQQLPWECLHHSEFGFLGTNRGFTLSRQFSTEQPETPALRKGPLKVLLFTSLPDDLDAEASRQDTEAEQAQVLEALLPWIQQGLVELETPDDGRFATLKNLLNRGEFQLVFLSGHGQFHHHPHDQSAYGEFLFESDAGRSEPIRDQVIAEAFVNSGVQCVVLSACESGKTASDALAGGLAQHLQQLGLPHVIGMRESVMDRAGILFARAFCDAVGRKQAVDVALQQARQAITQADQDAATELSVTQWCLPALYTCNPDQPLIDWDFEPQTQAKTRYHRQLEGIGLPEMFIGRRRELRLLGPALYTGQRRQLLLTGPGGQGKTTLAGQLALRLKAQGYLVLTYLAHQSTAWEDFLFNLEFALDPNQTKAYEAKQHLCTTPAAHAEVLLTLLVQQTQHKMVLFFDNLESIQQSETRTLVDKQVEAWIKTALDMGESGPHLLLTSRWKLPDWPESAHHALTKPSYGDFLRYLQQIAVHYPLEKRAQLREVYHALGGNFRGFEFFLKAANAIGVVEEQAFLAQLAQAQEDLQTNMAIERVFDLLSAPAKILLHRLCAYADAVPWDGVFKLAQELEEPKALLAELTAFSLTAVSRSDHLQRLVYQNDAQVTLWLQHRIGMLEATWYRLAAEYQMYLFETDQRTVAQAFVAHQALVTAGMTDEANALVRRYLVGLFTLHGLYHALLETWLPPLCASDDPDMKAYGLGETGKLYIDVGDYDTALDYLQQSLAILKAIGDKQGEGVTRNNISQIYQAQGDYDTALDYLQQSLAIVKTIGYKQGEGATRNNISQIYQAQGDYDTALDYLQQSLAIVNAIGDKKVEGITLNNIGQIYQAQGDYDTALDYLQQSLAIVNAIGDKQGEGVTLNNIALIYQAQGDYDTALDYLQQTLAIVNAIGDKQVEGATRNNISQNYRAQGDYNTALDYLQQSLAIVKAIGDKQGEGVTLNNIATIYQAQGDYDTALDYLQQSLAIRKAIGDKQGEGATLNNISQIYHAQGDYDTALDYLQQSLAILKAIGDKQGEGATLNNISQIYKAQGNYDTALDYLQQSLAIRKAIGDKQGEGGTLNNISQIYDVQGDYDTALDYLQQSLAIQQAIGNLSGLCRTLFNVGFIHLQHKQPQEANAHFVEVYRIAKQLNEFAVLEALEGLAKQLDGAGLSHWEDLLQQTLASQEGS